MHQTTDLQPVEATRDDRPATAAPLTEQSGSVLVVDDNEANRDALCRRLARKGYTLSAAADGPEALRLLGERAFDLILLDVMMPGMNGLEVLEHVRRDRTPAELPVIMATAQDQSEDVVRALSLGANDYVTKPLDFAVVLARVRTQVAIKQSHQRVVDLERRLTERNRELEAANVRLLDAADRTRRELQAAAKVQESLLPKAAPATPGLTFAWAFRPCQELAGDSLNICPFSDGRVGAYVLDVSGHGVGASLLAVAATRLLSPHDPDSVLVDGAVGADNVKRPAAPRTVATRLDERFGWNPDIGQFITLFYVLVDPAARQLTYVSAGHPGAVHVRRSGVPSIHDASGMPIGLGDVFEQHVVSIETGDRVYLYTDGVLEAMSPDDELFGSERLIESLIRDRSLTMQESINALLAQVSAWSGGAPPRDDVSVLGFELI